LPSRPQGRKAARGDRLFVEAVIFRARTMADVLGVRDRFFVFAIG